MSRANFFCIFILYTNKWGLRVACYALRVFRLGILDSRLKNFWNKAQDSSKKSEDINKIYVGP